MLQVAAQKTPRNIDRNTALEAQRPPAACARPMRRWRRADGEEGGDGGENEEGVISAVTWMVPFGLEKYSDLFVSTSSV